MRTRFAPSPTGPLHLGHAYSALIIWDQAQKSGGEALLRIEDTDSTRCRPQHINGIFEDLHWLGLTWPQPVLHQSQNYGAYDNTLKTLGDMGLLYPCSCTRKQVIAAGGTPGWDGMVYPGTCHHRPLNDAQPGDAIRLKLNAALEQAGPLPPFTETGPLHTGTHQISPQDMITQMGDPVLKRKDPGDPAYHLACPHDDATQSITHVIRGADLWHATYLHVLLQTLLGWPIPTYHHHDLIRDADGKRLAKIALSKSIKSYRDEGLSPGDIRAMLPRIP